MTSYVTPKKNAAFITYVALEDQANAGLFKTSPTIAAGDCRVSIDGGALTNLATLPTNTPSGSAMVKISLSADEMNGDNITVVCKDAAGDEWYDLVVNIQTTARQIDDLAATGADGDTLETLSDQIDGTATASALATVDGIVDALALVAPDNKPTVAATGEAFANVSKQGGLAVAAADANGNVPVDVKLWKGVTINDLVDGNVVVKLADVAHGGSAATLNLKKLSLINPTDNDPALYLEAKHTPVVQSYALLTVLGRYGWEISDGMAVALYPALVTEETLRSNLRIVTGALSDPVGMTATVDQDLYGTDAYVGWMLFLEYHDRGLNRWAAKVVSHTATTITLDDTIPGAGTFWLLPATGLSAQQTRDAMKLAPSAGAPAAGSVDAHLDALALEATAQAILEDTGTTLPTAIAVVDTNVDLLLAMDTSTTDATTAGAISRRRGNSWSIPLTIGAITGYTSLWFTIKSSHDDADASALLQIKLNASGLSEGLLYVK